MTSLRIGILLLGSPSKIPPLSSMASFLFSFCFVTSSGYLCAQHNKLHHWYCDACLFGSTIWCSCFKSYTTLHERNLLALLDLSPDVRLVLSPALGESTLVIPSSPVSLLKEKKPNSLVIRLIASELTFVEFACCSECNVMVRKSKGLIRSRFLL